MSIPDVTQAIQRDTIESLHDELLQLREAHYALAGRYVESERKRAQLKAEVDRLDAAFRHESEISLRLQARLNTLKGA